MYQLKGVDTAGNNRVVVVCGSLTPSHMHVHVYVLRVTKCYFVRLRAVQYISFIFSIQHMNTCCAAAYHTLYDTG